MSPVTRIMFKTVVFAFRIFINLLNIRLVFTKWMKKYLQLEFVLVIFTRCNLFRQFAQATNAYHVLDGSCSTVLNDSTNVVTIYPWQLLFFLKLFVSQIDSRETIIFEYVYVYNVQQCASLKECILNTGFNVRGF